MANNNTVKKKKVKMSTGDKVFTVINTVIMILVCIAIVYPLYYVLLASVTDPVVVSSGKFLLYPEAWYTNGYTTTLKYQPLWTGYANTIKYTVVGTLISLVCTIPAGYALSRYDMVGRKPIMFLFTFTMFFSGGMIPMYLTVQQLHIYNTTWAMVLPVAVSAYNLIVCRSFFESGIPVELLEAAKIDGCSDFGFFFKIAIPLSNPQTATLQMYLLSFCSFFPQVYKQEVRLLQSHTMLIQYPFLCFFLQVTFHLALFHIYCNILPHLDFLFRIFCKAFISLHILKFLSRTLFYLDPDCHILCIPSIISFSSCFRL